MWVILYILFCLLFIIPSSVNAQTIESSTSITVSKGDAAIHSLSEAQKENIFITEFYPNPNSEESEWVELFNNNEEKVSLEGWYIDDAIEGGSAVKEFIIQMEAKEFYVIELESSMLNNSGNDSISLLDENKEPIYIVSYDKTKRGYSIQKLDDNEWYITEEATKSLKNIELPNVQDIVVKKEDSLSKVIESVSETSTERIFEEKAETLTEEQKKNILITEFMPNPEAGNEWVEIYNNNSSKVNLTDWYIDDINEGGGSPINFSAEVAPNSYYIIEIERYLLNNSNDSASLLDNNNTLLHEISYTKTKKGSSIQKLSNDKWYVTSKVTKEEENIDYSERENTDLKSLNEEVEIIMDAVDEKDVEDSEEEIENVEEVLGVSLRTDYRKIPYYKAEHPFTPSKISNVHVISSKDQPTGFETLLKFIERAFFW